VLAMRPLMAHSSPASHPETTRHRRILHLEFSGQPPLPDGFDWYEFTPGRSNSTGSNVGQTLGTA
jgi:hypothetical protein